MKVPRSVLSAPAPVAAFGYPTFTSFRATPQVWGLAYNIRAPLVLTVTNTAGVGVYAAVVATSSGLWHMMIYPAIQSGWYALALRTGTTTLAQGSLRVGASPMHISSDYSLGLYDVSDGKLMRFRVTAGATGASVGQLGFSVVPQNTTLDTVTLYGFTDQNYSIPIAIGTGASIATVAYDSSSPTISIVPAVPIAIPPNKTYYFELDGSVTPGDSSYSVTTKLLGDAWLDSAARLGELSLQNNLLWSPNSYGTSTPDDADWFNGSSIPELYGREISQERYATPVLGCDLEVSTSSILSAMPVTLTWTSTGANAASWAGGGSAPLSGSITVVASSTRTYTLTFSGSLGTTQCYQTVYVGQSATASQTSSGTATPSPALATLSATPSSGLPPLTTTLSGIVNGASSCAASTYTLGYGDNSTTTIAVAKNLCKPQAFSISHKYSSLGMYVAKMYAGTFTSSYAPPLVATTTVSVVSKLSASQMSLPANVFSAFGAAWRALLSLLGR